MKKMIYILCILYFAIAMLACGSKSVKTEPVEVPQVPSVAAPVVEEPAKEKLFVAEEVLAWHKSNTRDKWSEHLFKVIPTLGKDMMKVVPSDYKEFCPNFKNLTEDQRVEFYAQLLSIMVKFESSYKPETTYTEGFDDAKGNRVISRGLLQISIESGNSYDCQIKKAQELHDPFVNLSCGVRILNRWVSRDGRIAGKVDGKWRGGARYWSVLRKTPGVPKESYDSIKGYMLNRKMCKISS